MKPILWSSPSQPADIEAIPWLGQSVIDRMTEIIKPDFRILEHGSGGSTLWFSERARKVVSFETDKAWRNAVLSMMKTNVYVYSSIQEVALGRTFDLLLIDGNPTIARSKWIENCEHYVKPEGYVILDNANRPEYAEEREYLHLISKSVQTFDCNAGKTKYLVTDICQLRKEQ